VIAHMFALTTVSLAFAPTMHTPVTAAVPVKMARVAPAPAKMISGLEGPALVSAAHIILAYNLMPLGPTAYGLGMGGKEMTPPQKKWGDRAFGNTMEQFPLFNAALWLHAVFVDAAVATGLGAIYLGLRLLYPVIWLVGGKGKGPPFKPFSFTFPFNGINQLYFSTFPQYGIVFYMAFAVVAKLALGLSLNALVKNPFLVAPVGFGWFLYHYAYVLYPLLHDAIVGFFK